MHRNTVALVGACLASLLFGLEISSVPVILPKLESVLAADFKDLQWIMNAYTIACTTVLMATGTLATAMDDAACSRSPCWPSAWPRCCAVLHRALPS